MSKIKVCHFNGKRGGFGALKRTLRAIAADPDLELQIVVSDMHLSDKFGKTLSEVQGEFKIDAFIDMEQKGDSPADRSEAMGVCLRDASRVFEKLRPDLLLVLGDRGEVLSAVIAAINLGIPVFHVEGGDVTGNLDESFRHAITKMAHVHFPSNTEAAERIKRMGEEDWRVHVAGDAHIDPIVAGEYNSPQEMRAKYGLGEEKYLIVLQHSVTTEPEKSKDQMAEVMAAVEKTGLPAIVVYPCSDQGYGGIIEVIEQYRNNPKFRIHKNIPAPDFLGLLAGAEAIVGNSSSGIKEAPYLYVPAINIGKRQKDRPRDRAVIDVPDSEREAILSAINKARFDAGYRSNLSACRSLYGEGRCAETIVKTIKETPLDVKLFEKRMAY